MTRLMLVVAALLASLAPPSGAGAGELPETLFAASAPENLPKDVFAALPSPERLPANVFAQTADDEIQDLLLLSDARPLLIRVHLIVDGRGFRLPWGEFVCRVHAYLDKNSDGVLTVKETQLPNWQQMLMVGLFRGGGGPGGNFAGVKIDANGDGKVSTQELAAYLRPNFGPFQAQPTSEADARAEALFRLLDQNKDRKLSRDEIDAAASTLAPLDQNEDEALSIAEMDPYQNRFLAQQRRFNRMNGGQNNTQLLSLINPGDAIAPVVNNLINKYDKGSGPGKPAKDKKLDRAEIGLDAGAFKLADKNGDCTLDIPEITTYLTKIAKPDVELTVRVASATGVGTVQTGATAHESTALASAIRKLSGDMMDVDLDVDKAIIAVTKNPTQRGFDVRDFFLQNFKQADADGNGYVDKKEIQNNFLNQVFPVADRDGDEKLTEKELIAYLDLTDEAGRSRSVLSFSDTGRTLFDFLDDNHDRRLGSREIRAAWGRMAQIDRDKDGKITAKDLPRHLRLSFGRAQTGPQFGIVGEEDEDTVAKAETTEAPLWFLQMDRNHDGDVSPREFMGSPAAFSRIDTNHDGLISPKEAAQVK
jgi:Ca2+-binding EF-hand superfamily protein